MSGSSISSTTIPLASDLTYPSPYEKLRKAVLNARRAQSKASPSLFTLFRTVQGRAPQCLHRDAPSGVDRLSTLPLELLAEILEWLPARQIASAQTICRSFRNAVKCSSSLQYTIARYADGVVECPAITGLASPGARLYRLEQWKRARRKLVLQDVFDEEPYGQQDDWCFHGRVLSQRSIEEKTIRIATLPSHFNATPYEVRTFSWEHVFPVVHRHWYNSTQDILVILSQMPLNDPSRLTLFFLEGTNGKYSLGPSTFAANLVQRIGDRIFNPNHVIVKTLGDICMVYRCFRHMRQDVRVMYRKRGMPLPSESAMIYDTDSQVFLETMAFLDADHLVAVRAACAQMPASVVVIPWRKLPREHQITNITAAEAFRYATVFHLPQPGEGFTHRSTYRGGLRGLKLLCEPLPPLDDATHSSTPFRHANSRLPVVVLELVIGRQLASTNDEATAAADDLYTEFWFAIPGRTLMSFQEDERPRSVPWLGWGVDTRAWSETWEPCKWHLHVWSSRLFCVELPSTSPRAKIVVYDFDSVESMLRDAGSEDRTHSEQIVVEPSYLRNRPMRWMRESITTRAPYRRLETNIKAHWHRMANLHFGEDCLIYRDTETNRVFGYSI